MKNVAQCTDGMEEEAAIVAAEEQGDDIPNSRITKKRDGVDRVGAKPVS